MLCYKSTKEKHHGFMSTDQPPPKKRPKFGVSAGDASGSGHHSGGIGAEGDQDGDKNMLPADLTCPLCRRKFSFGNFRQLYCQPPPAGKITKISYLALHH